MSVLSGLIEASLSRFERLGGGWDIIKNQNFINIKKISSFWFAWRLYGLKKFISVKNATIRWKTN